MAYVFSCARPTLEHYVDRWPSVQVPSSLLHPRHPMPRPGFPHSWHFFSLSWDLRILQFLYDDWNLQPVKRTAIARAIAVVARMPPHDLFLLILTDWLILVAEVYFHPVGCVDDSCCLFGPFPFRCLVLLAWHINIECVAGVGRHHPRARAELEGVCVHAPPRVARAPPCIPFEGHFRMGQRSSTLFYAIIHFF